MRWFRMNPAESYAQIRPLSQILNIKQRTDPDRQSVWPYVGSFYETGPFYSMSHLTSLEDQLEWLERIQPEHLSSQAVNLECIALALGGKPRLPNLKNAIAIQQQLTADMRQIVETGLGVPVNQAYGLNEFGIVAIRCPEQGNYHMCVEPCYMEITDDHGRQLPDGEQGHLILSGISNAAMPLLRYDTSDFARKDEGPCLCGRTSPAFAGLEGRYRRLASLPDGTWPRWSRIQTLMSELPDSLRGSIWQYQLFQPVEGDFKLYLKTPEPLSSALKEFILEAWDKADPDEKLPLVFERVGTIPRHNKRKIENFVSEYFDLPPRQL